MTVTSPDLSRSLRVVNSAISRWLLARSEYLEMEAIKLFAKVRAYLRWDDDSFFRSGQGDGYERDQAVATIEETRLLLRRLGSSDPMHSPKSCFSSFVCEVLNLCWRILALQRQLPIT